MQTDLLFLFAELGVALAGFSAVIGVLSARSGHSDVRVDALRLQVMLETSLIVAGLAIIPALFNYFGIASDALWRIAAAVFLMIQIPMEYVGLRRTRNMPDMELARFNVNTINWCLSLGADLIALLILLGWVGGHAGASYAGAMFMLLTLSALLFIQFAASTFAPPDE